VWANGSRDNVSYDKFKYYDIAKQKNMMIPHSPPEYYSDRDKQYFDFLREYLGK
jgi:hypothetical protein